MASTCPRLPALAVVSLVTEQRPCTLSEHARATGDAHGANDHGLFQDGLQRLQSRGLDAHRRVDAAKRRHHQCCECCKRCERPHAHSQPVSLRVRAIWGPQTTFPGDGRVLGLGLPDQPEQLGCHQRVGRVVRVRCPIPYHRPIPSRHTVAPYRRAIPPHQRSAAVRSAAVRAHYACRVSHKVVPLGTRRPSRLSTTDRACTTACTITRTPRPRHGLLPKGAPVFDRAAAAL